MNAKLAEAIAAVQQLPPARQDELADTLYATATRYLLEERIACGEASYASRGGAPAAEVFDRLLAKYGS